MHLTLAVQEAVVEQVAADCLQYDIPFFLEPLSFSLNPRVKKLPSIEKQQVVVETARRLTPLGVDVLKAEFPLDISEEPDRERWKEACSELSNASLAPWVLLSAGVSFEDFVHQTEIACQLGASGVLAGRAVWKEAVALSGDSRTAFLRTTAAERLAQLKDLVSNLGQTLDRFPHRSQFLGAGELVCPVLKLDILVIKS